MELLEAGWPLCPSCQTARQTVCQICGQAGAHLPAADVTGFEDGVADEPPGGSARESPHDAGPIELVICPACDEPFPPRFYRLCQACGHDFGAGIEVHEELEPIGGRALVVMATLMAVAGAAMVYFYFLYEG